MCSLENLRHRRPHTSANATPPSANTACASDVSNPRSPGRRCAGRANCTTTSAAVAHGKRRGGRMNEAELRAENARLKQQLEAALQVNALSQAEMIAKAMAKIASGVFDDTGFAHVSMGVTCVNCGATFSSAAEGMAHDEVCPKHPAAIRAAALADVLEEILDYAGGADSPLEDQYVMQRAHDTLAAVRGT